MTNRSVALTLVALVAATTAFAPVALADPPQRCRIEGIVVDDEFLPLAGAQVAVLGTELDTTTDASGTFLFKKVPAGTQTVAAAKLGYESSASTVECVDGETVHMAVELEPLSPDGEPFVVLFAPLKGRIGCAVGALSISTTDICRQFGIDPSARNTFELPATSTDPITGAVYELAWTPTGAFGAGCLSLSYPAPKAAAPVYTTDDRHNPAAAIVSGRSPVNLKIESTLDDPVYRFNSPDSQLLFQVRVPGSTLNDITGDPLDGCNASAVVGQDFSLHVALFFNGAAIPPDFTMLA